MSNCGVVMNRIERQSRKEVWKMFDQISPYYDQINHLFSFGADIYWRRQCIRHLPKQADLRVLDLATGTGDQLIAIVKKAEHVKEALGLDLSQEMIRIGRKKIKDKPYERRITLMEGDATCLSLSQETIDCITMSFGIRNVTDVEQCLKECFRVLTPNGRLIILEFSIPKNRLIQTAHFFYLRYILSSIGGWISRCPSAYQYLYETIRTFPSGALFCDKLKKVGFQQVRAYPLTFGIATLYIGEKKP